MSYNPMISVVMSVYNAEKYLDEAIQSILSQTYSDFEFIIIDDGSTDKSLEIIEKYQKQDERMAIVSRKNKGLIASLNEGIEKAKGKYIARMDADDISLPTRFEEQIWFMEENFNVGVCGSWIEVFGENKKPTIWRMPINDAELRLRLLFSVTFAHPSVMMRKELIDKYHLKYNKDYLHAEDYKFWVDFSKYTKFANIPKVLLKYRYLYTSVSRLADNAKDEERYKTISNIFNEIIEQLCMKNTEEENKLHFIVGLNERIEKFSVDLKSLDKYLKKIITANKHTKVFDEKFLKHFLAIKFSVAVFYKIKRKEFGAVNSIFRYFFWYGLYIFISKKIFK